VDKRAWIPPAAIAFASYRVWRLRDHGIPAALGLTPNPHAIIEVFAGAAISAFSILLIFALESSFGWLTIDRLGSLSCLTNVSTPIVVAFVEEFVFRLALLGTLLLWINAPCALMLSAVAFSAAHLGNQHFSAVAFIYTFVGGLV
jgi:membrane protease YdiL (CAAX protease family)